MTPEELDELARAATAFKAVLEKLYPAGSGHPLKVLFNGIMMVYFEAPVLLFSTGGANASHNAKLLTHQRIL